MNGKDLNADFCIIHYSVLTIHYSLKEEEMPQSRGV